MLPQTIDEQSTWATLFPDASERAEWTHRLANLVFLTRRINTRASNWDFERKKKEYFSSKDGSAPFVITQGVLQTPAWTPGHLKGRQETLLATLGKLWRLGDGQQPSFAISIHKSQGSEFPVVVIPLAIQQYMLLERNLVYTGLTRGKTLVVMVGEQKALQIAIRKNNTHWRYSGLLGRLKQFGSARHLL